MRFSSKGGRFPRGSCNDLALDMTKGPIPTNIPQYPEARQFPAFAPFLPGAPLPSLEVRRSNIGVTSPLLLVRQLHN